MNLYSIFIKHNKEGNKIEDFLLVEDGLSYSALIFGYFWFLYHKMWKEFFLIALINLFLFSISSTYKNLHQITLIAEIFLAILIFINAKYWFCESLKKRSYELAGVIFAKDYTAAKIDFLRNLSRRI